MIMQYIIKTLIEYLLLWIITQLIIVALSNLEEPHLPLKVEALKASIALTPTDGLGISNSDLEQIGAKSYSEVDDILQEFEAFQYLYPKQLAGMTLREKAKEFLDNQEMLYIEPKVIIKVIDRHVKSEFKRKNLPICITRDKYE